MSDWSTELIQFPHLLLRRDSVCQEAWTAILTAVDDAYSGLQWPCPLNPLNPTTDFAEPRLLASSTSTPSNLCHV